MTGERPSLDLLKLLYTTDSSDGLGNPLPKGSTQNFILFWGRVKIQSVIPIYQAQSQGNKLELILGSAE